MTQKEKDKTIDKIVDETIDKELKKINSYKTREIVFAVMTCIFVTGAVLLYFANFHTASLFMQLCLGAATGCFVVAMQEAVLDQQQKNEQKIREKIKKQVISEVNEIFNKEQGKDNGSISKE